MELKIGISRGRNVPSEMLVQLTLQKGGFRQGNPMPLKATATAAAAVPTKTRPCRTGKHHGPQGRMESKIYVSRGRNVPSEISYKKLAIRLRFTFLIRFSMLATGSLLAAALLPLLLLLLMLLEP